MDTNKETLEKKNEGINRDFSEWVRDNFDVIREEVINNEAPLYNQEDFLLYMKRVFRKHYLRHTGLSAEEFDVAVEIG